MMEERTLEERVAALEIEVARMKAERLQDTQLPAADTQPSWKKIIGIFKDAPGFEEAVRCGREYREATQLEHDDEETHEKK